MLTPIHLVMVGLLLHQTAAAGPLATAAAGPLMLTPLLRAGQLEQARQQSAITIDGLSMGHSGFFSVPSSSGQNTNHFFSWYQPCIEDCNAGTPLIHYFNGGPGSPTAVNGGLAQVGNWFVHNGSLHPQERCFAWCRRNHCLFVDQPAMTGLSFQTNSTGGASTGKQIEYTKTSGQAMEQIYQVLQQFLQIWPQMQQQPYFIQGLSYAGMYVPWMGYTVWQHNKAARAGELHVKLRGVSVGDPVMANTYQYPTYAATLHGMGVVMEDERDQLATLFQKATALQQEGSCWESFQIWNSVWNDDGGFSCKPHCDFLFKKLTGATMTENVLLGAEPRAYSSIAKQFLEKHAAEFHFEGSPTQLHPQLSEGGLVYETMVKSGDYCNSSAGLYTTLFLEAGIDVVIYSSTMDPLLGPPTTEAGVRAAWDSAEKAYPVLGAAAKQQYYKQRKSIWAVSSKDYDTYIGPAGYAKCVTLPSGGASPRFCYVVVRNAGHEAPSFQPRAAYDMNERFLHGRSFNGSDVTQVPKCAPCGGVAPFAGSIAPGCHNGN